MTDKIKVLVVDDHALVRQGTRLVLEADPDLEVVGEASNGREAIRMVDEVHPTVVLMDVSMPEMTGFEATEVICREHPDVNVLGLTVHESEAHLFHMLRAGAVGYVLKRAPAAEVINAVKAASRSEAVLDPSVAKLLITDYLARAERGDTSCDGLSEREREILKLVAESMTNKEIAALLHLSVKTVQTHRANLMRKLGMHDRTELVRYAIAQGILGPEDLEAGPGDGQPAATEAQR